ncbi:MAG: efflux RND transporter permease subunit [Chlorobiota bacterium]|nr:efflux RND transporter permease subunit [Chlorobiota bacterium]QQS67579.1 MAG: efflux RND transporter permease subunit [Chlorobiota bacterium]
MTLTELAIKRPSMVVVIFAVLGVLGLFSFSQLKYELLPKISPPVITIFTVYPGAAPSEVESSVTKIVEDAVSGIDKISSVTSTSQEGVSIVLMEFQQSAKIDLVLQEAQRKVGQIIGLLPNVSKAPVLSKIALDEIPILRIGVTSSMSSVEFSQFLKDKIKPRFSKIDGISQITLQGLEEREIKINIDADRLKGYGLSIFQISQAVKASNLDFPTGNIKDVDGQFTVRLAGKFASLNEISNLIVGKSKTGGDITLKEVAEVQDAVKDITTLNRINGKPSVGLLIQKQSDANSIDVSKLARDEIKKIELEFSNINLKFDIAQDGSLFTIDAANSVKLDLLLAIVLVAFVMFVFLHSMRNSLIVMVAIPASLISTFIAMYVFNMSLNLMTLLGMSLVVGILVDDSIVVLENIYRRLEMGDDQRTAALIGRNEIGFAALSITLVDVVVFLPLALVGGLIGNILREFALVVVFSTLMSLFVSFTITPLLASRFTKLVHLSKKTISGRFGLFFESLFNKIVNIYSEVLNWCLKGWFQRITVMILILVLFLSSFMLVKFGFIGGEFITQSDRGEFSVGIELASGATVEQNNIVVNQVEQLLYKMKEVNKVFVSVGTSAEGFFGQSANNISDLNVALVPKESRLKSTDDVARDIKQMLSTIPGVKVRVNPIGIFGTANQTPIQVAVLGTNMDSVRLGANMLANILRNTKGSGDVRLSSEDGKPETKINIDRNKMAQFGLSIAEVGGALRIALNGDDEAKFRPGDNEYDIRIRLDKFNRNSTQDVGKLSFMNKFGQQVELRQFASIGRSTGPTKLQRRERNPTISVLSQAVGKPSGTIWQEAKAVLDKTKLPGDVTISPQGDLKNQAEGFSSMGIALLAAIIFVYLVMVGLYDSYTNPFVVLFSIPVALIGALLALALTMKTLNIFSILGMIMMIGLVAKNAILLVDFTNVSRQEGKEIIPALIEAGRERLRPILMTTLSMVIGMLPIALSHSSGAEWKSGLAWALIGGLTSSLILTLVLVPVVYFTLETMIQKTLLLYRKITSKKLTA